MSAARHPQPTEDPDTRTADPVDVMKERAS